MLIRQLSTTNDWTFGKGKQDYLSNLAALELNLKTRILSWVGDCFFSMEEGIDWKNLLDYNKKSQMENSIKRIALQTPGVMTVRSIVTTVTNRSATVNVSVQTIYGVTLQTTVQVI